MRSLAVCAARHDNQLQAAALCFISTRRGVDGNGETKRMASDLNFELAHVLFLDVVGYSQLLIDDQREVLSDLNTIVRSTAQFRAAEAQSKLICSPTGDGMVIAFFTTPDAAVRCAVEIARALRARPEMRLRMGIHCGPVSAVTDVNGHTNMAGGGVNMAQRVMDCGDAGHILLSQRVAEDLAQFREWHASVHELGESEIKHGTRIHLFNLWNDDIGNRARPEKCKERAAIPAAPSGANKKWTMIAAGIMAVLLLPGVLFWFVRHQSSPIPGIPPSNASIPEKSIAVLPFENLSDDRKDAFFADGIQDDILTSLAKIADLKVISRTSVMQYRGAARDLREIGKALGVANIVEGSVRREGDHVLVNVQLIDAQRDVHLWADKFDRTLADSIGLQGELATEIASALKAKLAPEEKTRLANKPTDNADAYLLYLQANELVHVASSKREAVEADEIYARAITLDPKFALARARASIFNSLMYTIGRSPERKARARELADAALQLAPNLGEAHLALGYCFYRIDSDYGRALHGFALAAAAAPNDSEVLDATGFVYRRQGRWREALAAFAQAKKLDPLQAHFDSTPDTLRMLRQWSAAKKAYEEALLLEPALQDGWVGLAYVQFAQGQTPAVASATLNRVPAGLRDNFDTMNAKWDYAMMARDYAAANEALPTRPGDEFPLAEPSGYYAACIATAQGDPAKAHALLEPLRAMHDKGVEKHSNDPKFYHVAGKFYGLLGEKEEAVRMARRAVELCPISKDAADGANYAAGLAFVYAHSGEADQAVALLSQLLKTPGAERITLAHLRLSWEWDPLRQNERFQRILAGPEPETILK